MKPIHNYLLSAHCAYSDFTDSSTPSRLSNTLFSIHPPALPVKIVILGQKKKDTPVFWHQNALFFAPSGDQSDSRPFILLFTYLLLRRPNDARTASLPHYKYNCPPYTLPPAKSIPGASLVFFHEFIGAFSGLIASFSRVLWGFL